MGKRRRKGNKRGTPSKRNNTKDYIKTIVENGNVTLECYYALQGLYDYRFQGDSNELVLCVNDEERNAERLRWRTCMGEHLPAAFRIAKHIPEFYQKQMAKDIERILTEASKTIDESELSTTTSLIQRLPFLENAYQLGLNRLAIRKNPVLEEFKTWINKQSDAGNITRQETVSMVPPVLLDVKGDERVLDMCAAPGSKTSQLLEDLFASSVGDGGGGCLVANDANVQRAYMLVNQLRRVLFYHPVALFTQVPAQFYPSVLQFHKILCDVPCTGDGTSRKNIDIWTKWSARSGIALHSLQYQIARKGVVDLLQVGGVLCYSTCSQNPIENEAVVAELLRLGNLELIECRERLGSFRTRPGMSNWVVLCEKKTKRQYKEEEKGRSNAKDDDDDEKDEAAGEKNLPTEELAGDAKPAAINETEATNDNGDDTANMPSKFDPVSFDQATLLEQAASTGLIHCSAFEDAPEDLKLRLRKSLFPPTRAEAKEFHLERCIRCLPHDNDTGGFFVALLRKTGPMSRADKRNQGEPEPKRTRVEEEEEDEEVVEIEEMEEEEIEVADDDNKPVRGIRKGILIKKTGVGKDDFIPASDAVLDPLIEFYGLQNGFDKSLYMCRASSASKVVYYISRPVRELFDLGIQDRVTVINAGLKGFAKNAARSLCTVDYRVCQEGVHFLVPFMTKRKFVVCLEDFKASLSGGGKTVHLSKFSKEFEAKVKTLESGSFVILLEGYENRLDLKLVVTLWKCRGDSVDALVAKAEMEALLKKVDALEEITPVTA